MTDSEQETPKRPKDLNIPSLRNSDAWRNLPNQTNDEKKLAPAPLKSAESPETPSYSSKPLPMSPNGPQMTNISITSPEPRVNVVTSPDPDTFAKVWLSVLTVSLYLSVIGQ